MSTGTDTKPKDTTDATPPHSLESECAVLATMLSAVNKIDRAAELQLLPSDFHNPDHRTIYDHLREYPYRNGDGEVDVSALKWTIKGAGQDKIKRLVADHLQRTSATVHFDHHVGVVKELASRRRVIEALSTGLESAYHGNGSSGELLQDIRGELEGIEVEPAGTRYDWTSDADLDCGDYAVEFLIDRVLAAQQPGVIAGPSKAMKTSLIVDMGNSLAYAQPFLGHFPVRNPVRVGVMSGESGMAAIQNCNRRVRAAKGLGPKDAGRLFFCETIPRLDSPTDLDAVRREIEKRELQVLFLDPLYQMVPETDTGSLNKMGAALRAANMACREADCTPVLCHHSVKKPGFGTNRKPGDPLEREDVHGAGIGEWMRQWILVNRAEPYEPGGHHVLNLVIGGSAGHSSRWIVEIDEGTFSRAWGGLERWDVTVRTVHEARGTVEERREQEKIDDRKHRIVAFMKKNDPDRRGLSRSAIQTGSNVNYYQFSQPFGELVEEGALEGCKIQVGNQKTLHDGYRLAE